MSIFKSLRRAAAPVFLGTFVVAGYAEGPSPQVQKVQGRVSGFANLARDGWVDVALVFPTLTEDELLSFDFSSIMSPNEPLKAGPIETQVPGNLVVPEQKERYGIFPVTLKKDKFTLLMEPLQPQELFVLALRAPFPETVEKARNKAPASEIIKLVKFGQLGFHAARDWTLEPQIDLALNRDRPNATNVTWARSAPAANEMDLVVNVEKTPAGRWLVSDLDTHPQEDFTVKSTDIGRLAKLLFARSTFANGNKDLINMRAWFATYRPGAPISASQVPSPVEDVKLAAPNIVTWNPGLKKGWVSVIRREVTSRADAPIVDVSKIFFPDLSNLSEIARPYSTSGWTRVEQGHLEIDPATSAKNRLIFVFLGGDRLTAGPALAGAEELQVHHVASP